MLEQIKTFYTAHKTYVNIAIAFVVGVFIYKFAKKK